MSTDCDGAAVAAAKQPRPPAHLIPRQRSTSERPAQTSTGDAVGLTAITALTAGWFTMSWHVMGKPVLDAVGETVGGVSSILVVVSTVGAVLRSRR